LEDKKEIGYAAELRAMGYEKRRVGRRFARLVEHVSLRNVAAGYDIRSVNVTAGAVSGPRYIEVKLVSGPRRKFYWTSNEINVARLLGRQYYLYLLPVTTRGAVELASPVIIENAWCAVLGTQSRWEFSNDVIACSLTEAKEK
jgi:hypothetical protein